MRTAARRAASVTLGRAARRSSCAALIGVCLSQACASGPETRQLLLRTTPPPSSLEALGAQLAAIAPASPAPDSGFPAIAIGSDATGLWGLRLDASPAATRTWRYEARVSRAPVSDRKLVAFGNGSELTLLESSSGKHLWSIPGEGLELLAIAELETGSALMLGDPRRNRRWLALMDEAGHEYLRVEAQSDLGVPAAWNEYLLIPWGQHFVSAVNAASGDEVGRAHVDSPVHQVLLQAGQWLVGGPPWLIWSSSAQSFVGAAPAVFPLPRRPLPGPVSLPAVVPANGDNTTTSLYPLPESSRASSEAGAPRRGTYLATFGRVAIGLDAVNGAMLWVKVLPGRILRGAALADSHVLCDASGSVRVVEPRSAFVLAQLRLARAPRSGLPESTLDACTIVAGKVAVASRAPAEDEPLIAQLTRALAPSDAELAEAQRFLSRELAGRPEPEATLALIDLATRRSADRVLQAEAEDLLASRRNGVDFMLRALADTDARISDPGALPPLGALADALLALEETRAAPLLALALNRPGHSADALSRAAVALEKLATAAEYRELSVFFSLQRTSADQPDLAHAVSAIGRTLLRIGGDKGRNLVSFAVRDTLTVPAVREALTTALPATSVQRPGGQGSGPP